MKNLVRCSFLILLLFSCENNQNVKKSLSPIEEDQTSTDIFEDPSLNEEFLKYLEFARNYYEGDKIHVISFEGVDSIEFTGQLGIERTNLIGHIYFDSDVILIYDNKNIASQYIRVKQLKHDSITGFQYFENMDDVPPFDPPTQRLRLADYKKVDKGLK